MVDHMDALKSPFLTQKLIITKSGDDLHSEANALIKSEYYRHFNCQLKSLTSTNISLKVDNKMVATTGYRSAGQASLYLEQYLDQPIEQLISKNFGQPIDRCQIVEIGSFALGSDEYALPFMFQLAPLFSDLGYRWATCTVTRTIKRYLDKLGVDSIYLAKADPTRVIGGEDSWGTYYDHQPVVLAGNIQSVVEKIAPFQGAMMTKQFY